MQSLLMALATVYHDVCQIYMLVIFVAVILSMADAPANAFTSTIRALTAPLFFWIRRRLPFVLVGGWDLSPLVLGLIVKFLDIAGTGNLMRLASQVH